MSVKIVGYAALVLLLASIALPASGAMSVGGESVGYTVEEETVELNEDARLVQVDGAASTGRHDVAVHGPSCQVDLDDATPSGQCQGPRLNTDSSDPAVDVDVDVDIRGDQPENEAKDVAAQRAAGTNVHTTDAMAGFAIATAVAGAGVLGAYGLWRGVRFLAVAGVIPLYSRIRDDELLDDPNRARIFALIRDEPGVSTKDIADRLDLAWGTVTHHLNKIEKRRMIVSKKYGKYRRFFANGAIPGADGKDAVAVLRVEKTAGIAAFIRNNPGLTQKEVSAVIGVSPSTVLWHVKRLERADLVRKVRDGKHVKYFATEALEADEGSRPAPHNLSLPLTS